MKTGILEKRIPKTWAIAILITMVLVGAAIGKAITTSNPVTVQNTETPFTLTLYVNGTIGSTFPGPTHPGDVLNLTVATSPVLSGKVVNFYDNSTLLSPATTNAQGIVYATFTMPALISPPNPDYYIFTVTGT